MTMRVNSIGTVRNNFEYSIDVVVRLNTTLYSDYRLVFRKISIVLLGNRYNQSHQ